MSDIAQTMALGLEHHQAGRLAQAEQLYRQVIGQNPRHVEALQSLAILAVQSGRKQQAIALLEQAVAAEPDNPSCLMNLGSAYVMAGRHEDARAPLERAIRIDPTSPGAHYHLGLMLEHVEQIEEAIASYRRSIELEPVNRPAHNNAGKLLRALGRLHEAAAHFDAALAIDPNAAHVHYNRGLVLLSQGRYAEGWNEYEWRLKCRPFGIRELPQPMWDGSPLVDKTLLVHAEQGLGDTIQFLRFLPTVRARCRHVLVEVPRALVPLCRHVGIENVLQQVPLNAPEGPTAPVACDFQIPMPSLPRALGTTLETIPADIPYLQADERLVAVWRDKLSAFPGCKVGIAWQGSRKHWNDKYRSIPLACFGPLAEVAGVRLLSVQKGDGIEQLDSLGGQFDVVDVQRMIAADAAPFMDVAAILMNLDLVVTCDTSVAHLAGALGVPVWVALSAHVDWRWLLERRDSPWYPTMRLFRQATIGDWPAVFAEITAELRTFVGSARRGMNAS